MKSLAYVVSSVMTDIGVSDEKHYVRFLKWAVDGYRKMNLHGLLPTIRSIELEIDKSTNSANIPDDYIEYLKIGVCRNGYMYNFDYNSKICLPRDGESHCPCEATVITPVIATVKIRSEISTSTSVNPEEACAAFKLLSFVNSFIIF